MSTHAGALWIMKGPSHQRVPERSTGSLQLHVTLYKTHHALKSGRVSIPVGLLMILCLALGVDAPADSARQTIILRSDMAGRPAERGFLKPEHGTSKRQKHATPQLVEAAQDVQSAHQSSLLQGGLTAPSRLMPVPCA